jgi:putative MATE family efflux protein
MMKKRNRNLTEGNIKKQLFSLTWPMLFGMLGMVIFNLADTYFVGKLGVKQLAAMSFSFPVVMFINGISQGIGIGTSSLISRNILSEHRDDVKKMASRAILFGLLIVLLFVVLGLSTIRPIFTYLGASDDIVTFIFDYMSIWYLGVPFVVMPMIGNNIVRAIGDTFVPGMIMLSSALINIILDPILIFGYGPFPEMGIRGAALATVISRSISMIIILIILIKREKLITLHLGRFKEILQTWKNVIHVAGPATLSMLITPISIGLVTKIISAYGKEAVAAFGVASRIEMFVLMVIVSLATVIIIFIGQNYSKKSFYRIFKSLNYALKFSMLWGALSFIIFLLLGQKIASLFTDNTIVIQITVNYLYIIGASYGFQGLVILSSSAFNGINKPYPATIFTVIRMMVLYVPLAFIASKLFGINGIFWAALIANILIGILSYWHLHKTIHQIASQKST